MPLHKSVLSRSVAAFVFAALLGFLAGPAGAADKDPVRKAATPGKPVPLSELGLPHYQAPPSYHEDLVVHSPDGDITMKRSVDHGRIRTDMDMKDQSFTMIELGDEPGTVITLVPGEKRAMKYTRAGVEENLKQLGKKAPEVKPAPTAADILAEDLGDDNVDGVAAKKVRMISEGSAVIGWFDKATGAPLKMQSDVDGKKSEIEWKNRKAGTPSAEIFEVPKGYQLTDMDEFRKQMNAMSGMGGMAKGMAGGMAQGMGQGLGSSLGSTIGGTLGGPLGAAAGHFIGGKVGGMLGKKAAGAITH